MIIGVIYRSPSSKTDNDLKLYEFINTISRDYKNNLLLTGWRLQLADIDCKIWSSPKSLGSETKFVDILRKNYLLQYIDKPTRIRGDDELHVLDLVLTNEPFIAGIDFLAPLGKSDHSVLHIHCTAQVRETTNVVKYNYTKGDYDSLRISCQINWEVVVVDIC